MPSLRLTRRAFLIGSGAVATVGCGDDDAFVRFETSAAVVRAGTRDLGSPVNILFRMRRAAVVEATLIAPDGTSHTLRSPTQRDVRDDYQLVFDGTVPVGDGGDRNALPNGIYDVRLVATEPGGRRDERRATLTVEGSDMNPLDVDGPTLSVTTITPDGDGVDDEVTIAYSLSRPATVEILAGDADGNRASILASIRKEAGRGTVLWDGSSGGRVFGGKRMPDGLYTLTLRARDDAGNVRVRQAPLRLADGGIERLEIADVSISPMRVKVGDKLTVRIEVVNTGETTLRTMGPPPGTSYSTKQSFSTIVDPASATRGPYQIVSGAWRVGIGWKTASQELPVRWGLLPDAGQTIPPKGRAIVTGTIVVEEPPGPGLRFWAGAIREGVGLTTGRVGDVVVDITP